MSGTSAPTQMSNGGLTRLYDAIEAVVPGVVHPVVQMVVWDALDEFCTRSTYWRERMEWVLPVGQRDVDLNPVGANAIAVWVLGVTGLLRYSVYPPAIVTDEGDLTQARSGFATVACKPSRLSDFLPGFLVDNWFEGIKDGALGRLYLQPAKPYTSPKLAEIHMRRFRNQMNLARDAAQRFNTGGPSAWRFPRFAPGRRKQ